MLTAGQLERETGGARRTGRRAECNKGEETHEQTKLCPLLPALTGRIFFSIALLLDVINLAFSRSIN